MQNGAFSAPNLKTNLRVYSSTKKTNKDKRNLNTVASGDLLEVVEKLVKVRNILGYNLNGRNQSSSKGNSDNKGVNTTFF